VGSGETSGAGVPIEVPDFCALGVVTGFGAPPRAVPGLGAPPIAVPGFCAPPPIDVPAATAFGAPPIEVPVFDPPPPIDVPPMDVPALGAPPIEVPNAVPVFWDSFPSSCC